MTNLNPFYQQLRLPSALAPADLLARIATRLKTSRGEIRENIFNVSEATFGVGGAVAAGSVEQRPGGSLLTALVRPGTVVRYAFPIMMMAWAMGAYIFAKTVVTAGFSSVRAAGFAMHTALFVAIWAFSVYEMRPLTTFLKAAASEK